MRSRFPGDGSERQMNTTELIERLAIEDAASLVDRAVDDKRWDDLASHLADPVRFDMSVVGAGNPVELSRADFVQAIAAASPPDKRTFHTRSNVITRVYGDRATLSACSYGWNLCTQFDPPVYEVWGRMDYDFARIDGRWLITAIRMRKWREAGNSAVAEFHG